MEKILLDTDIGSDIDDAVCLAYLLANPDVDLLGITTVTGESRRRAQMASALCHVAGKKIPIYPGVETPLLISQRQVIAQQADALSGWTYEREFPEGQAIPFLRDIIRSNPGEITLLTIGPLTNIGLLFAMDPEIPGMLKKLVMMCGVFSNKTAGAGPLEWNAMIDPHATAIAYRHPVKVHRSVGLDISIQVSMPAEEVKERFQHELLRPVLRFAEIWFKTVNRIIFHDPLAAATIFDSQICQFERGTVEVELTSPKLLGMTHWCASKSGTHEVACSVAPEKFFDHYFRMFV